MTLSEWMAAKDVSDETLAAELGIDRSTASRIRRGKLLPSSRLIAKIVDLTRGAVPYQTFFEISAASSREDAA